MASVVDICNLALARIGDAATVSSIDPPEGSVQAEHCARFYPIVRDALLEMHAWHFARGRLRLAALDVDTWNWSYAYAAPSNALRVLKLLAETAGSEAEGEEFERAVGAEGGAPLIYSDLENATALCTLFVTDSTRFSPLFVDVIGWLLASALAGPVVKGDAGAATALRCYQTGMTLLAKATSSDANQQHKVLDHTPAWIGAR